MAPAFELSALLFRRVFLQPKSSWICVNFNRRHGASNTEHHLADSQTEFVCEASQERTIARTREEYLKLKNLPVIQPTGARLNRVAIIGMPNAGKSTVTNQLVGWRISSVSSKVHTTRSNVIGVFGENSTQVEILDTPGLVQRGHCKKFNLENSFMEDPERSSDEADMLAVICDVSNPRERQKINQGIFRLLYKHRDKPSILVLNKIDAINIQKKIFQTVDILTEGAIVGGTKSKTEQKRTRPPRESDLEELFKRTESRLNGEISEMDMSAIKMPTMDQRGWRYFSRVFMISALHGDGVEDLRNYLIDTAKPNPWKYNKAIVTDQNPEHLVKTIIQEKLLDHIKQEIPYEVKLYVESWCYEEPGVMWIAVDLVCPKERYVNIVLGPKGAVIAAIAQQARQELSNAFHCDVRLKLIVKSAQKKK